MNAGPYPCSGPAMPGTPAGPLGRWYADPKTEEQAAALLVHAEKRLRAVTRQGAPCTACRLVMMIAHFWLGQAGEADYQSLRLTGPVSGHATVLAQLIHGQLLMSRRLSGAMEQLDAAFEKATALFHPKDYFLVWKRHQILRLLPLSQTPQPAAPLSELLRLALVIGQIKGTGRQPYFHDPSDTYG